LSARRSRIRSYEYEKRMRVMFAVYILLIAGGIALYVVVGLSHH
jgi:hypothetical protein